MKKMLSYAVLCFMFLSIEASLIATNKAPVITTVVANLSIFNNTVNRDFVALPIIQLNVNQNLNNNDVSFSELSNFVIVNQIVYNTSSMDDNGNIINEFNDVLTLCPKKPGKYTLVASIKNGKGCIVSNGIQLNITPSVCAQLQAIVSENKKLSLEVTRVQAVKISSGECVAYVPQNY
ncbi:MAG: hypothetical protein NTX05_03155 [Fusobacteria bacterium]|nr:hypothetical protein [Fusobacteriota bacterium]